MGNEIRDWTESALWQLLLARDKAHSENCRLALRRLMPDIQSILVAGNTSPKDFTLHDAGHSFRVAERMHSIVTNASVAPNDFELTLLLLSSYLHDIGMTPEFKRVQDLYAYLLSGDHGSLDSKELDELQTWLDDQGYEILPNVPNMASGERLKFVGEIATHYCRHRHNFWSGEWLRDHFHNERLGSYDNWLADLILLCQSHHFGYDRLTGQSFRARWVGEPPELVNLRFLALVLRIADILEFDPERTPEIVFRHRDIAPESQIYWWKDKGISLKITGGSVVISARPRSARLHKAMDDMVDAIDAELSLCRKIADESPLGAAPGSSDVLAYKWVLPASAYRDIVAPPDAYEYINGAFRPDTKKLLSLLSGTVLYRDPMHAIRELVQNAFDAVSERIAYQRLSQPNPASAILARQLSNQHRVSLQLEMEGADVYLSCTDNGIGMNKAIIRDRILVSGSGPRHDVRALDRRCKAAGFHLGRSGQFGIGVLSYFMLATNVEMETQRAQEAGDADSTTWQFETGGVGSFGELRKSPAGVPGTRARLRLKSELTSDLKAVYTRIRTYLLHTVVYCPCEFYFTSPIPECEPLEIGPGWSQRNYTQPGLRPLFRESVRGNSKNFDLFSTSEKAKRTAAQREFVEVAHECSSRIRFMTQEGTLSDGAAQYVITLPYFELEGGASLAFFKSRSAAGGRLTIDALLEGVHFRPEGGLEQAWKGMAAIQSFEPNQSRRLAIKGAYIRINWLSESAATITVDRRSLVRTDEACAGEQEIHAQWQAMMDQFLRDFENSEYAWFNRRISNQCPTVINICKWLEATSSPLFHREWQWSSIKFPAISRAGLGYRSVFEPNAEPQLVLAEKPVNVIPWSAPAPGSFSELYAVGWNAETLPPDGVAYFDNLGFGMIPFWVRRPRTSSECGLLESKFAPEWKELCGAQFEWYAGHGEAAVVWNREHHIIKRLTSEAWAWSAHAFRDSIDPIPERKKLLSNRSFAACWLLRCVSEDSSGVWEGLSERDPEFLPNLFALLYQGRKQAEHRRILFWVEHPANHRLRVLECGRWRALTSYKLIRQFLPCPSEDWTIRISGAPGPLRQRKQ